MPTQNLIPLGSFAMSHVTGHELAALGVNLDDLAYAPGVPAFIAAYGYQPATLDAVVADLFGAQPPGHLPVTIRGAGAPSTVIAAYGAGLRY